jgi:DNA-binding NarL/FixJ family response regulator
MISTLVVDDDPNMRELVRLLLDIEDDFFVVGDTSTGGDALAAAAREQPGLIFSDIKAPQVDAVWAVSALRAERTPISTREPGSTP